LGNHSILTAVKDGELRFPSGLEGTVSVFCLGADAQGVDIEGLHYPLKDGVLTAGFPLGVSNHFTGREAVIRVRQGSLLVLWDRKNGFPERG
jgi:thiamine pyrophosphokinase